VPVMQPRAVTWTGAGFFANTVNLLPTE
jgi:hypothetical protein